MRYAIGALIIGALVAAWYWLWYLPSQKSDAPPIPDGTPCSTTGGTDTDGFYKNGVCTPKTITNFQPAIIPFKPGDKVYVNAKYTSDDVRVYTAPKNNDLNTIGTFRASWYGTQAIGTFIEHAGTTGFVKVKLNNLQIYKPLYSTTLDKISGDYFIGAGAVSNTPY